MVGVSGVGRQHYVHIYQYSDCWVTSERSVVVSSILNEYRSLFLFLFLFLLLASCFHEALDVRVGCVTSVVELALAKYHHGVIVFHQLSGHVL